MHTPPRLAKIRRWFSAYCAAFCRRDAQGAFHYELKRRHSIRVCAQMRVLADQLGLSAAEIETAQVIGLLHDVGRFRQYERYRTFNDQRSEDHAVSGVAMIQRQAVLAGYGSALQRTMACAITHHNKAVLPADLQGADRFWCRLIRDGDKLDIYRVALSQQRALAASESCIDLYRDLPDDAEVTDRVYDCIMAGGMADFRDLVVLNDLKLMQMGWVFDLNFRPSFERVWRRRYLQGIYASMAPNRRVERAYRHILAYLEKQLEPEPGLRGPGPGLPRQEDRAAKTE